MIDVRPILDEPPLHMSFSPGTSDRLVVSFAGVGNNRRQVPPVEFARIAHWNGQNNVLYISDQSRSWMNGPGIADAIVEAIRGIVEKLHEAIDRGLWAEPDADVVAQMQRVYLELEGDLEDR